MYLKEVIGRYENEIVDIYVDMDGVIADYDVGKPYGYDRKRPLYSSIKKLREISMMNNITFHILSISKKNVGVIEKNEWLDKYVPFIKKENRFIISKEEIIDKTSAEIKAEFLNKINKDNKTIILIDDDPRVLKEVGKKVPEVVLLKDTVLVD